MKKYIVVLVLCLVQCSSLFAQRNAPEILAGKGLSQFDFFYAGESKYQNMYIVRGGKIVWEYKDSLSKGEISDAILMKNGNILFAYQFGIKLIDANKKILWQHNAPANTEIHTAQLIGKDHVVFVQNADTAKVIVMNIRTNKVVKQFEVPVKNPQKVHGHFRHARLNQQGNLLVSHMDLGRVVEYDLNGKVIYSFNAAGLWAAEPLPNNNILVCTKNFVRELNHKGDTIWNYSLKDIPDYKITSPQVAIRLENGNTVINNWFNDWNGKVDLNNPPVQAIEVTKEKKIVWALCSWKEPFNLGASTIIQPLNESEKFEKAFFGTIK